MKKVVLYDFYTFFFSQIWVYFFTLSKLKIFSKKNEICYKNMGEIRMNEFNKHYISHPTGSHDSLSYTISASAPLAPDCPKVVRWMERLSSALTRAVLYRWSVTQSATLEEQLRNGVRYLDVRVAIQEKGAPPLVVHHLCGAELGPLLAQLDAFLTAHPQEVVVVDFQHFYGFERLDHERLIAHLQGLFGARLCPYWPGATEEATLRWLQVC